MPEATAPEPQTARSAPWPAHADDLDALLEEAFRLLARGAADRHSPFHTPTIATVGPDGAPQARTMVLRSFDAAARRLSVHTDLRSGKMADLERQSRVAVHAYDPRHAVQLRLSAVARLHADDAVSQAAWAASRASSRAGYAIDPGPGRAVAVPPPMPQDPDAGRPHFAVLVLVFDQLEWLWLSHTGHRRARFDWGPEARRQATWLVP